MRKGIRILLAVLLLFLTGFVLILLTSVLPSSDVSAPEDLESMEVYQMLNRSITSDTSPDEAVQVFLDMCSIPVDCSSDMILVEYYYLKESGIYNIHLARQFGFSDSLEYVQLHLDLYFSPNETKDLPQDCVWYNNGWADLEQAIWKSRGYLASRELTPKKIDVCIDWSW